MGAAVESGTINFRANDGKLFGGGLTGGRFEFAAPTGSYQVRIDAPAPLPSDWKEGDLLPRNAKRLVPLKYANFKSSGISANVTDDAETHNIEFAIEK